MRDKTPDTGESGIERRNLMKALGFGAMGLAGVGAMSGGVAAAGSVVNTGITPPDEDLEDDEILPGTRNLGSDYLPGTAGTSDTPTLHPSETDGTYDLVVKTNGWEPDETALIGKSFTVLSAGREPMPRGEGDDGTVQGPELRVTKSVFEEGTAKASTEDVMADTDGVAEIRQNFSVEDLGTGEYMIVLTCVDYSPLQNSSPVAGGGPESPDRFREGVYPYDLCSDEVPGSGVTVAHGFNIPPS